MYATGYYATGYYATGYYLSSSTEYLPASREEGYSGVILDRPKRKDEEELMLIIQLFIETIS